MLWHCGLGTSWLTTVPFAAIISWICALNAKLIKHRLHQMNVQLLGEFAIMLSIFIASQGG